MSGFLAIFEDGPIEGERIEVMAGPIWRRTWIRPVPGPTRYARIPADWDEVQPEDDWTLYERDHVDGYPGSEDEEPIAYYRVTER
jgi:hypothetical protein